MICKLCYCSEFINIDSDIGDYEYESSFGYSYLKCANCGLYLIDPLPDSNTLEKAYSGTYHAYNHQPSKFAQYLKKKYWQSKIKRCLTFVAKDASILDIGCSLGDFLFELRERGFKNIQGIEYKKEVADIARARWLDVLNGSTEDVKFKKIITI
ncbi:MAG: class I SAM-dependent methyltransferase [Oligoflexia bacterium]|nr:class I SAM-dependent methyltransferase [Oligoflexia bacterium]